MNAIIRDHHGSQDALELGDIDKPAGKDGEVLVRVQAASVHVGDWMPVDGRPFVLTRSAARRP